MKPIKKILGGLFILGGFVASSILLHAQDSASDLDVMIQAVESTTPMPATNAPSAGNFYSTQHLPGTENAWPPLPGDVLKLPVWSLGDGFYLLDDSSVDYDALAAAHPPMTSGLMPLVFTTNDLWLEIDTVTNDTASLVIHPPSNVTNGVYDLEYCTNLDLPIEWQWLLRTDPGQTNLTVANATDDQGFYRLAPPNDLTANDSLGTNFWLVFFNIFDNYGEGGPPELTLYISSPVGATGTVFIPGLETNTFSVTAGSTTSVDVDGALMTGYNMVESNDIISVTSTAPVSVYGVFYLETASAAFTSYPTPLLGTNYCIMSRTAYEGAYSQFAIVATSDNTTVTITPSATAGLALSTNTFTLQKGQAYQITTSNTVGDVTGTLITSSEPVGVFAGDFLALVPNSFTSAGNPLVQEQLPVEDWGTQALALSFAGRTNGDTYRILTAVSNTVTITMTNGTIVTNLAAGTFYEKTNIDGVVEFQGSQPIQVAQFANGDQFDGAPYGDPCEILLLPTGHYLETNTIVTLPDDYDTGDFSVNYLNLIVAQSATNNTFLDVTNAITNFIAIGTSGYYGAQVTVTNSGTHTVTSSQPVGVEVYGFGYYDAYSYFGGVVK